MRAPSATSLTSDAAAVHFQVSGRVDLATIFREHGPYVYTVLRSLGVHPSDVDDAFQEVLVVVHRELGDYEDRGSVRAWVYGI